MDGWNTIVSFWGLAHHLPLDPKTMKNDGFQPPIYGL